MNGLEDLLAAELRRLEPQVSGSEFTAARLAAAIEDRYVLEDKPAGDQEPVAAHSCVFCEINVNHPRCPENPQEPVCPHCPGDPEDYTMHAEECPTLDGANAGAAVAPRARPVDRRLVARAHADRARRGGDVMGFMCGSDAPAGALRVLSRLLTCCDGAANRGPAGCTCWEPVYDLDQAEPRPDQPIRTRAKMCEDCAYRPTSPERTGDDRYDGTEEQLLDLAAGAGVFWCHQGIRSPIAYRHTTLGITVEADASHYKPLIREVDGEPVPFKADGSPGNRCAGWAAMARLNSDALVGVLEDA